MDRQAAPTQTDSPWPHRVRSALLLSACAEALAAPFAGKPLPRTEEVNGALTHPDPRALRTTHGSAQTLVVAEHFVQGQGTLDEDGLAAALTPHHRQGSHGNDAAVRATPIGLLPYQGIGAIAVLARRSAAVTHTHPLAHDGAAVFAVAVALAAHQQPSVSIDVGRFLVTLAGHARTLEFRASLGIVRTLVRHRAGPAETAATVGHDATALRSVPAALAAYLRHPEDPSGAIRYAILIGGDTPAIAAMTGALAGARNTTFPVPAVWSALADTAAVDSAATALAKIPQVAWQ